MLEWSPLIVSARYISEDTEFVQRHDPSVFLVILSHKLEGIIIKIAVIFRVYS
jgi:hypothetical protein